MSCNLRGFPLILRLTAMYNSSSENTDLINWLLEGDISLQYQTKRDLLGYDDLKLRQRIRSEGWGQAFLSRQKADGHWGIRFYQPKWISTHYTLLDIRNLNIDPSIPRIDSILTKILKEEKGRDGGICPIGSVPLSDVCINGMFLNYACYFRVQEEPLHSVVDFLLTQRMKDGGFNCRSNRSGAVHSSMHSTLSVLEGFVEYEKNGYSYRSGEIKEAIRSGNEFLLKHHLYLSDRTGAIIRKEFLKLTFPSRWRYDILRALDYFQYSRVPYDSRMLEALHYLLKKRNPNGTWNMQAKHPGEVHFEMEKAGQKSRWNTLRALRVLKQYEAFLSPE